MITFFLNHKIIVGGVGLLIAVLAWIMLSGGGSPPTDSSLLSTEVIGQSEVDKDLVSTLLALRAVKLDATLFSDPAFVSLKDFSVQIVPEPVGRPNPFAPLGVSIVVTSSSTKAAQIFTPGAKKN